MPVEEEETLFEGENGQDFWSMSGAFIHRKHEKHRSKLYIPNEETFLIPLKYVDVMRQTRTSKDNASEHTLNGYWHEGSDLALSEEWIGTTRF